uniref:Uncharacterized protein n=1 Tax=Strix occidentalis caurina TaxID=311401 RepID=A0A8D0F4C4_STROC
WLFQGFASPRPRFTSGMNNSSVLCLSVRLVRGQVLCRGAVKPVVSLSLCFSQQGATCEDGSTNCLKEQFAPQQSFRFIALCRLKGNCPLVPSPGKKSDFQPCMVVLPHLLQGFPALP